MSEDLDKRLTEALEQKPAVRLPEDFAQRVALRAAAQPPPAPRRPRASWGVRAVWGSAALLLAAMFLFAYNPTHTGWGLVGIESLCLIELAAGMCGLMAARRLT